MAIATDENYLRENGLTDTIGIVFASSSTPTTKTKTDVDDVPDYNEAFPQLTSASSSNTFFTTSTFNGNGLSSYSTAKNDEDRRRKLAIHEKLATTKIVNTEKLKKKTNNLFFFRLKFLLMIVLLKILDVQFAIQVQIIIIAHNHYKKSVHEFKKKHLRISLFSIKIKL